MKIFTRVFLISLILILLPCACQGINSDEVPGMTPPTNANTPLPAPTETDLVEPQAPDETPVAAPTESQQIFAAISPGISEVLGDRLVLPPGAQFVSDTERADLILSVLAAGDPTRPVYQWVYALAAPFPTVVDEFDGTDLLRLWRGEKSEGDDFQKLVLSPATMEVFSLLWGAPAGEVVMPTPEDDMLQIAWEARDALAIIPFESLSPRWKVLRIGGVSPIDQYFDPSGYMLTLSIGWVKNQNTLQIFELPPLDQQVSTNRDPQKFTSLVLTGTTALVRSTALRMEEQGVIYPAADIRDWLVNADLLHISNEVSFYENCPPAIPLRGGQRFCSDPRYIDLLTHIGADIIELSGNHLLDWGIEPFVYSLELYEKHGMRVYGGGRNLDEARRPLILEHNGNRLGLIGCNRAGPENIWAGEDLPGTAACDLDWIEEQIAALLDDGILPIVTFQHYEVEDFMPMNLTRQEFRRIAQAGAVIVSGSQAHFAHGFEFVGDNFIHLGLGNLFFDQMFPLHRRQFIDRHIFYDGKYLGVELLTAMLEDYARPRPMNTAERAQMLADYFRASGW